MILTIKTSSDIAEFGIYQQDGSVIDTDTWEAGRTLSDKVMLHIRQLLGSHNFNWDDIKGVAVFNGPGSFTGLRIGVTIANTLAYVQKVPIVGAGGDNWLAASLKRLAAGENDEQVVPNYGAPPNISRPKRRP